VGEIERSLALRTGDRGLVAQLQVAGAGQLRLLQRKTQVESLVPAQVWVSAQLAQPLTHVPLVGQASAPPQPAMHEATQVRLAGQASPPLPQPKQLLPQVLVVAQ
jgi:hypothetical protein